MRTRKTTLNRSVPSPVNHPLTLALWLGATTAKLVCGQDLDPQLVGEWLEPNRSVYVSQVGVSGEFAYVVGPQSLHVIDVSDKANPQRVGSLATRVQPYNLAVSGNIAVWHYTTYSPSPSPEITGSELEIVDLSIPSSQRRVGVYSTIGDITDVVVVDDIAFIAGQPYRDGESTPVGGGGLQVIDLTDPARPTHVGGYGERERYGPITVSGEYAYLGGAWQED